MLLRPRQELFVARAREALAANGNTLCVAPTGFGKTIALSAIIGEELVEVDRALVLQHRDELLSQNRAAFVKMWGPTIRTSVIDAKTCDPHGRVCYAMVQSLVNRLQILPRIGLVATDETHHSAAKSYRKVYDAVRERNPDVRLLGVTATPERGDKKSLASIYTNVADVVTLGELVRSGHLVRPDARVIDIGVRDDLSHVKRCAGDFDMDEVATIMDKTVNNEAVIKHWREAAASRQTVVFCATVAHAAHVCEAFRAAGVAAEYVHGDLPIAERRAILARFDKREFKVLCNVMVLTEGWDCPAVSCVVLLRPSSQAGTMIQMVGRGLRRLDPERYPGIHKSDCIILDFGTSLLTHGSLDVDTTLEVTKREGKKKACVGCQAMIPAGCKICPLCGHEHIMEPSEPRTPKQRDGLDDFAMTRIDLLNNSPFRWEVLFNDEALIAASFACWAAAVKYAGAWYAVGGSDDKGVHVLAAGDQDSLEAIVAADDWMRTHGKRSEAGVAKSWLLENPTPNQLTTLRIPTMQAHGLTRYRASCMITWQFNHRVIREHVLRAAGAKAA